MQKLLLCPRTEICFVYSLYVERTRDESVGIIEMESIENRDFYTCKALNVVLDLAHKHQLPPETAARLEGIIDCLLTNQANRAVEKRRSDF
ncbi:MAG: hypothetical protein JXB18_09020 [Sedimentisphaerales bacterium]|nr:hypothetical protein [Sedimentisphaerales bacterium]